MPYWRLYYHLVWATKDRMPLITPEIEPELHGYLIGKADALDAIVHEINSVDDHTHVIVSIPPKISVSDFVGQIKGASAFHINHAPGAAGNFGWQRGYGIISVSPSGLEQATEYVRKQKEHHQRDTIVAALECVDIEDDGPQIYIPPANESAG